ncbi:MAG: 3-hydroxyacyl-CoA dehydrogenase NAD-binding domain-containing protein [Thermoguttaceae bacterium]
MIDYQLRDGVVVLRLDAPPPRTITLPLLEEIGRALERAIGEPAAGGIVITGGPEHFSAGADVSLFRQIAGPEDAVRISRAFQERFQQIEDSPKPVVAAMAGTVAGGALELAMACHYRVATPSARFRMPEVTLGIVPGSGGTQRLPRLVGPAAALQWLLSGEPVDADEALACGLLDAVCGPDQLIQQAAELVRTAGRPRRTSEQSARVQDPQANRAAFSKAEQAIAAMRPELIAPRKILQAVRIGLEASFEAGLREEQQAFAECMATLGTQNKIYLFIASRQTAKLPELEGVEPAPIAKAAVVGLGTMGSGIAQALVAAGFPVVAIDQQETALSSGIERIRASFQRRVGQGRLSQDQADAAMARLATTSRWEDLAEADLVIEAVYEDVAVKRAVFQRLQQVCPAEAILATNSSTISLEELGAGLRRPERLIGLHFFHPAQRMPLVEVIRRGVEPPSVLSAAVRLVKRLGKTPVVVKSREGFLVNRIFVPYLQEAFAILEEGAPPTAIDQAMLQFGFPMGPLALIDMSGLDILVDSQRVLSRAFDRHGPLSAVALRLVERGQLGQKTGCGVYCYQPGDHTPHESPQTAEIVAEVQRAAARVPRAVPAEEITQRLVLRMVNEAYCVLEEGVARCQADIDVATVLGMGFPDFRGGVLKYAQDTGPALVLARLEGLAARLGPRFEPGMLLKKTRGAC